MTSITTWIYAKLEHIIGTLSGLSVIALDIPNILLKVAMAVILGGAGALGSHLVKWCIQKVTKKLKKK